ncbi:hypothetical protein LZ32DRAFT_28857 [Colletotrichum eremochloae]|nr:hypothetical protein LZ32DRAFT_28857 [Colletotrichum eremochloae]
MNASIPGSDGPWLTTSEREPKCALPFACVTLRTTAPPGGRLGAWPVGIVPVNKAGTCLFAGLQGLFEDEAGIVPLPCRVVPLRAVRDASTCQVPLRSGIHRHEGAAVSNTKGRQRADTYLRLVALSVCTKGRDGLGLVGTCRPPWWKTLNICSYSSSTALAGRFERRCNPYLLRAIQRLGARLSSRSTWAKGLESGVY